MSSAQKVTSHYEQLENRMRNLDVTWRSDRACAKRNFPVVLRSRWLVYCVIIACVMAFRLLFLSISCRVFWQNIVSPRSFISRAIQIRHWLLLYLLRFLREYFIQINGGENVQAQNNRDRLIRNVGQHLSNENNQRKFKEFLFIEVSVIQNRNTIPFCFGVISIWNTLRKQEKRKRWLLKGSLVFIPSELLLILCLLRHYNSLQLLVFSE